MAQAAVDYDALAKKHGGSAVVDYDALAQKHGGTATKSAKDPEQMSDLERTVLGLGPKQDRPTWLKAVDFATSSIVPGLSRNVRERDAASESGLWDPRVPLSDRLIEGATSPLGLAGEVIGALPLLRLLRGAKAAPVVAKAATAVEAAPPARKIITSVPGFAEPPIIPKPKLPPGPMPLLPEAVAARPTKQHVSAAEVVEFLKQKRATTGNAVTATANDVTPAPARTAGVVFDDRLAGASSEANRFKLPETKVPDEAYDLARRNIGIEKVDDAKWVDRSDPPSAAVVDAAALRGRATLASKLPEGVTATDAQTKLLDDLSAAYRKADQNLSETEKLFFENRTTSENLQKAKLARRAAGKDLRQAEVKILKDAEDAAKRGISKEAGVIAPQLMQALAGGVGGAATGAALDEEDPIRGAAIGAFAGALAPGTIKGTAKSLQTQGLKTVGKVYISGLISGPMSMVRNVTSTAANGLFRAAAHPAAVGFDYVSAAPFTLNDITPSMFRSAWHPAVVNAAPATRSVTLNDITPAMIATWKGFKTGATDALKTFVTGQSPYRGLFSNAPPMQELAGGLGNAINWPGRALDALDTWLGRIVEAQSLASGAYTEAFNRGGSLANRWKLMGQLQANPSSALQSAADAEARRVLFRGDPGKLSQLASKMRSGLNDALKLPVGDFLIPFVRVPAEIARQAVELTPFGALQSTAAMTPRQTAEHYGRVFAGSLLLLKGAELAVEGRVSGSGPTNPQDRAKLMETGWRPYAINMAVPAPVGIALSGTRAEDGTFWIPTNALGPVGTAFGMVGDMAEGWRDSGERDEATNESRIKEVAGRIAHSFADQTFLSDAVDLAESLDNPSLFGRYIDRKMGSLVPAVVRQGARAVDPVVRDPQGIIESIKANIPGLSTSVPPRIDRFGEEVIRPTGSAAAPRHPAAAVVEAAGVPLNKPQGRISVTEPRLRQALESAGFEFDENDVIKLTPAEKRALQQRRAKQTAEILASLRNSQTYTALPKDAQQVVIERLKRRLESDRRMPELLDLLQQRKAATTK